MPLDLIRGEMLSQPSFLALRKSRGTETQRHMNSRQTEDEILVFFFFCVLVSFSSGCNCPPEGWLSAVNEGVKGAGLCLLKLQLLSAESHLLSVSRLHT